MKNRKISVICVLGTRPEAIKMVPVIRILNASDWAKCVVVVTAQHRGLLDQMLKKFEINSDYDLNLMQPNQSLGAITSLMLPKLEKIIQDEDADVVLAQGDTATVFNAALAAFHKQVSFGHLEAGLRSNNLSHPFPEEGYRQMVSRLTRWHFAPTKNAAENLLQEGILRENIFVVGNTGIDTLLQTANMLPATAKNSYRYILLTAHRRENFGQPLKNIFQAVLDILSKYQDIQVIYPVHPNPNVRKLAYDMLGSEPRVKLVEPMDYFEFIQAMQSACIILTDSGGVQEEAPALGKPVLVLRETTERPEPIEEGVAKLIGTNTSKITEEVSLLLSDPAHYQSMARVCMPYGDGQAANKLIQIIHNHR